MNYFNADNCDFSADQMELANRAVSAPQTPLPLIVRKTEGAEDTQFMVECDFGRIDRENGKWDDQYLSFSGFFGTISPHVFAAAPELLEALQAICDLPAHPMRKKAVEIARAAIAKATA